MHLPWVSDSDLGQYGDPQRFTLINHPDDWTTFEQAIPLGQTLESVLVSDSTARWSRQWQLSVIVSLFFSSGADGQRPRLGSKMIWTSKDLWVWTTFSLLKRHWICPKGPVPFSDGIWYLQPLKALHSQVSQYRCNMLVLTAWHRVHLSHIDLCQKVDCRTARRRLIKTVLQHERRLVRIIVSEESSQWRSNAQHNGVASLVIDSTISAFHIQITYVSQLRKEFKILFTFLK